MIFIKKLFSGIPILLFLIFVMTGCNPIGDKTASFTIIYAATTVHSFLLLLGYCFLIRKKSVWFVLLFSSVLVVNIGYFCLAVSSSLEESLLANRIAYLGSVFLPLAMYMITLNVTNTKFRKWFPVTLLCVSLFVFFVAASPGYLDIYYKEVSFEIIDGVSTLVKVYGPWHLLYLVYLLGYFSAMVAAIIRATIKKTIDTTAHAVILAIAVFVNIGVWLIEQLVSIQFEILSISYIISELFLLGVHLVINENQRLIEIAVEKENIRRFASVGERQRESIMVKSDDISDADCNCLEIFDLSFDILTQTEHKIFEAYINRVNTKDIIATLGIKEDILKYHTKNICNKLGVSSHKELLEAYKQIENINLK